jgi:hypothetical protein
MKTATPPRPAPLPTDPLSPLVAAVFDPAVARSSGCLRPLVRLPRRRRVGVVSPPLCRHSWSWFELKII